MTDYKSNIQSFLNILWESWETFEQWQRYLLGGWHDLWHRIKSAPSDHIMGNLDIVWGRSNWFPCSFPNLGWVLGLSLWARDKGTKHAGKTHILTCYKQGQVCFIFMVSCDLNFFFVCKRYYVHWLSSKGPNYQWRVLFQLAKELTKDFQKQMPRKAGERSLVSSGQCSSTTLFQCKLSFHFWSPSLFS